MTSESKRTRRRYGAQFKATVLAQCEEAGVSVAQVAMHRWQQLAREGKSTLPKTSEFITLPMTAPAATPPLSSDIHVEVRRGPVTMIITWPAGAAAGFAIWKRELLR